MSMFPPCHSPSPTWEGSSSGRLPNQSCGDQPIRLGLLSPGCSSWPAGTSTWVEQLLRPRGNNPASMAGGSHPGKVLPPLLSPRHKL